MTDPIQISALPSRGQTTKVFEGAQHGGPNVSFLLVDLPPGEGPPPHVHPYEEVFVIQEGAVTFTIGEGIVEAGAGTVVIAPAGVPHTFVNSGDTQLRSINIHPASRIVTEWLDS